MKFKVKRASSWVGTTNSPHPDTVWDTHVHEWTVDLETLEDLRRFANKEELIIDLDADMRLPTILIYDTYVE